MTAFPYICIFIMELRQLRYFAKAAETLSFSEAARVLNVAQSTLSQQVKQLEDELGVTLFERGPHSISLTEPGERLLPMVMRTIHDADTCTALISDLGNLLTGTLNIGVTYSFGPILTETVVEFIRRYPDVKLNIYYKPMAELMKLLKERTVDFVLAFRPTEVIDDIESHVLFDNHLSVIVREGHSLASSLSVALMDLARYDLALPSPGLQARNAFDLYVTRCPVPLNIKVELNEVNILLELIRQSNLVTVLAEATVYNHAGVRSIPLILPSNQMEGCVHLLRNSYRKHSAVEFIKMLKESHAVRARIGDWFR